MMMSDAQPPSLELVVSIELLDAREETQGDFEKSTFVERIVVLDGGYCEGEWKTSHSSHSDYSISAARTTIDPKHLNTSQKQWVAQACPFQMSLYSCYFHTNRTQAALLEERNFYPQNTNCLPFRPYNFLTLLQGRHLVFLGDSILLQIWESLACTFNPLTPIHPHYVNYVNRKPCNMINCPENGTKRFSYLNYGWIHLPAYQLTLTALMVPKVNLAAIHGLVREAFVHNNQQHSNHKQEAPAGETRKTVEHHHHPTIFYFESSPQHFSVNAKGYYPLHDTGDKRNLQCKPLPPEARQGQLDWRNQVISRALANVLYNGIHRQLHGKPPPPSTVSYETHTVYYGPSLVEGSLIRCQGDPNGTIYLLEKGWKRAFLQRIDLELAGYRPRDIIMMTKEEVQHIPIGPPFPSLQNKFVQKIGEELDKMEKANWSKLK
eukprot:scaffold1420_cov182-Ochromonas_danica.AAC.1